ncbi:hypothetical protein D3C76_1003860 [compost metagenome]
MPKSLSPIKNTKVAVRLTALELIIRPPEPKASMRLSPVPVLPPITSTWPLASLKLPAIRRAVPASTTCERAPRRAAATSEGRMRLPLSGSLTNCVS